MCPGAAWCAVLGKSLGLGCVGHTSPCLLLGIRLILNVITLDVQMLVQTG